MGHHDSNICQKSQGTLDGKLHIILMLWGLLEDGGLVHLLITAETIMPTARC